MSIPEKPFLISILP